MSLPRSWPARRAMVRFYARPVRDGLEWVLGGGEPCGTWPVHLGPIHVAGCRIELRSPQLGDAAQWRAARLRERERIEPWWLSSDRSWEERHTESEWTARFLEVRKAARSGRALPLVVLCDGGMAGECNLEWIAPPARMAEMGIWLDSRMAGRGVSAVAAAMMIDYAMIDLGLQRLTAPICEGNLAASWGARRIGMVCEGTMSGFLDVGGKRRDHHLWALTSDQIPPGGLAAAMIEEAALPRSPRVETNSMLDIDHN